MKQSTPQRARIKETADPVGKWAVFRRSDRAAKFHCLHDDEHSAVGEAQRLAAESMSKYSGGDSVYYVVHIDGAFGIQSGKLLGI